jgi:hypothetical protein
MILHEISHFAQNIFYFKITTASFEMTAAKINPISMVGETLIQTILFLIFQNN